MGDDDHAVALGDGQEPAPQRDGVAGAGEGHVLVGQVEDGRRRRQRASVRLRQRFGDHQGHAGVGEQHDRDGAQTDDQAPFTPQDYQTGLGHRDKRSVRLDAQASSRERTQCNATLPFGFPPGSEGRQGPEVRALGSR